MKADGDWFHHCRLRHVHLDRNPDSILRRQHIVFRKAADIRNSQPKEPSFHALPGISAAAMYTPAAYESGCNDDMVARPDI